MTARPTSDITVASTSRAPVRSDTIELPSEPFAPQQLLAGEDNVLVWPTTPGFRGFWGWCQRRCERIKGKEVARHEHKSQYEAVAHLMGVLDALISIVAEVPPDPQSSQRFGNLAFRRYSALVKERLPGLLIETPTPLPPHFAEQVLPLLIESTAFGHPTRLDYGSGHELAFMLALWCCVVSGYARQGVSSDEDGEKAEDELILRVFARYLDLVTLLQQTYRLEPAGSHGVWGLDDYCFFPYLFGSAQLLDSPLTPSLALARALAPAPTDPSTPLPLITDLYTLSLYRLTLFKRGAPFSEHSPLLHSLAQMPNWHKPHYGLRKMFLGEVAGKRVVVQGLWVGGWCWGVDPPRGFSGAVAPPLRIVRGVKEGEHEAAGRPERPTSAPLDQVPTVAPWARSGGASVTGVDSRAAVLEATRASWASPST